MVYQMLTIAVAVSSLMVNAKPLDESPGGAKSEKTDEELMVNPDLFEGDMLGINLEKIKQIEADKVVATQGKSFNDPRLPRFSALSDPLWRWPDGIVPYKISNSYSSRDVYRITAAFQKFHAKTCIRFVPRTVQKDYINIIPDNGCYSYVGNVRRGSQIVSLANGCLNKVGIIIHELLHAIGFIHEQSRADRDEYVQVLYENILDGLSNQFSKYSITLLTYLNTSYDFGSVMHYGTTYFSKNGKPTLLPKQSGVFIGQRDGFSPIDILRVNRLYQCVQSTATQSTLLKTTQRSFSTSRINSTNNTVTASRTASPTAPSSCQVNILGTLSSLKNGCWYLYSDGWYFGIASCDDSVLFQASTRQGQKGFRQIEAFVKSRKSICPWVLRGFGGMCCRP